jgi:hypothetical protein
MDRLRHAKATHHVLCITHKSYFDLPFIWHEERWRIFIDEIPALDTPYDWPLPMNWPLLAAHIELGERYMPGLYVARAQNEILNGLREEWDMGGLASRRGVERP